MSVEDSVAIYVTRHEKTGLMFTKYTTQHYDIYLLYCLNSINCIGFPMKCCINGWNSIKILFLLTKLFEIEI